MKFSNRKFNISNLLKKALLTSVILLCPQVWARVYTWTGADSANNSNWTNYANWSPNTGYPGENSNSGGDVVILNSSTTAVAIDLNENITISGLLSYGTNACTITGTGAGTNTTFTVNSVFVGSSSDGFRVANGLPTGLSVPNDHKGNLGFAGNTKATIEILDSSSYTENTSYKNEISLGANTEFTVTVKWDTGINKQAGNRDRTVINKETGATITFSGTAVGAEESIVTLFNDLVNVGANISSAKSQTKAGEPAMYIWKGTAASPADPTDWSTATNWLPAQVPASTAVVVIPNTTNKPKATSTNINSTNVSSISLYDGAELTITDDYTLSNSDFFKQPETGTATLIFGGNLKVSAETQIPNIKIQTNTLTTEKGFKCYSLEVTSTSTLKSGTTFLVGASADGLKFGGNVTITGTPAQSGIAVAGNVKADSAIQFIVESGVLNHSIEQNRYYDWSDNATVLLQGTSTLSMSGNASSTYNIKIDSSATDVSIAGSGTIKSLDNSGFTGTISFGTNYKDGAGNYFTETMNFGNDITFNTTGTVTLNKTCVNLTGGKNLTLNGDLIIDTDQLTSALGVNLIFNKDAPSITTTQSPVKFEFASVTFKDNATLSTAFTFDKLIAENLAGKTLTINADQKIKNQLTLSGTGTGNELTITGTGNLLISDDFDGGDYLNIVSTGPSIAASDGTVAKNVYFVTNSISDDTAAAEAKGWVFGIAGQLIWRGTTSTDWETETNWIPKRVPNASTDVVIIQNRDNDPVIAANKTITIGELNMDAAASLSIGDGSKLTVSSASGTTFDKAVTLSGEGTLIDSNGFTIAATTGNLTFEGTTTLQGNVTNNGTITVNKKAKINGKLTNAGTITIANSINLTLKKDLDDSAGTSITGTLKFNGSDNQTFTAYPAAPTPRAYNIIANSSSGKKVTVKNQMNCASLELRTGTIEFEEDVEITTYKENGSPDGNITFDKTAVFKTTGGTTIATTGTITANSTLTSAGNFTITNGKLITKGNVTAVESGASPTYKSISLKDVAIDCADNAEVKFTGTSITISGSVLPTNTTKTQSINLEAKTGTITVGTNPQILIGSAANQFKNITISTPVDISFDENVTLYASEKITVSGQNITFSNYITGNEIEVTATKDISISGFKANTLTLNKATDSKVYFQNGKDLSVTPAVEIPIEITNSDFTIDYPVILKGNTSFKVDTGDFILASGGSFTPNTGATVNLDFTTPGSGKEIKLANSVSADATPLNKVVFNSKVNFTAADKKIYANTVEFAPGSSIDSTTNAFEISKDLLISKTGATSGTFDYSASDFTVPGNFTNNGTTTLSNNLYVKGNFSDSGTFTSNKTILNGVDNIQSFTPKDGTVYSHIEINKTVTVSTKDSTVNFDTNKLTASQITVTKNKVTNFNAEIVEISGFTDTSDSGAINFAAKGLISANTTFNTPGTVTFGGEFAFTSSDSATKYDVTHIAGSTKMNTPFTCKDGSFAALTLTANSVINCSQITLNGDVTADAGYTYFTVTGNIIGKNVSIYPKLILNGGITGTYDSTKTPAYTTFKEDLFITDAGTCKSFIAEKDFIICAPGKTVNTEDKIYAANVVLYSGNIVAAASSLLQASKDVVLLGAAYSSSNPDIEQYNQTRLSATNYWRSKFTDDENATLPDGTTKLPSIDTTGFSGTYDGKGSAILHAGKNFYANGVTFTGSTSAANFIDLPDLTDAYNGFAEAYNCTVAYSTIGCHADNSRNGTLACLPAYNCTETAADTAVNWLLADFTIQQAYTVRDNAIWLEFSNPVRNKNNEIANVISELKYNNDTLEFSAIYSDEDCETAITNANVTSKSFYIKAAGTQTWNTDANKLAAGSVNSTDRNGVHQTAVLDLSIPATTSTHPYIITDIWGKRLKDYTGANKIQNVADHTGPVLYSVQTGQELHEDPTGNAASSQHSYDAHNFIEFRYSEPVDFVLDSTDPTKNITGASAENIQISAELGTITNNASGFSISGIGTIASGKVVTGKAGTEDNSVNAWYRNDDYSIRLSIAGYTEGTATDYQGKTYKKWAGYIKEAVQASGAVTIPAGQNSFVLDRAATPNKQTTYAANKTVIPAVSATISGTYGPWDISRPIFAPLNKLDATPEWAPHADGTEHEAIGYNDGAGSTLRKIEFHVFDNTPNYSQSPRWVTGRGWMNLGTESLYVPGESYCADIYGGSRPTAATDRTSGGLRYSTLIDSSIAFKYEVGNVANPTREFGSTAKVYHGAASFLFTGSSNTKRIVSNADSLYFGLELLDTTISLKEQFTITYDENVGFVTDLAGNLLESKRILTVDKTPPSFDYILAPVGQNEIYMVFVKDLETDSQLMAYYDNSTHTALPREDYSTLIPKCFELFTIDASGTVTTHPTLAIDTTVPVSYEKIRNSANGREFTALRLRLNRNITLQDIEQTCVRLIIPTGYTTSYDSDTGLTNADVTFIQDSFGNYMPINSGHALSDLAINVVNPKYAYDEDMSYAGEYIMNGLYENGSWAVHDWNEEQMNYGSMPANHNYTVVANINNDVYDALCQTKGASIILSASPTANSVSKQINDDFNAKYRLWTPDGTFTFLSPANNLSTDSVTELADLLTPTSILQYHIDKTISTKWGADKQVSFLFGLVDSTNAPVYIYNVLSPNPDGSYNLSLSNKVPLYAVRLKTPGDITSIDLWSFKVRGISEQRGGITILNNVINITNDEDVVVKVNMPSDGKLNVMVMTLDGNIIKYLNHGNTSSGEHFYSWDGRNLNGNPVARGMYFIRVTGNGIDETRKVMVVK